MNLRHFYICKNIYIKKILKDIKMLQFNSIKNYMMMMNSFCGMADQQKTLSLVSSQDHCQRSSPSQIFAMAQAGF